MFGEFRLSLMAVVCCQGYDRKQHFYLPFRLLLCLPIKALLLLIALVFVFFIATPFQYVGGSVFETAIWSNKGQAVFSLSFDEIAGVKLSISEDCWASLRLSFSRILAELGALEAIGTFVMALGRLFRSRSASLS